VRAAHVQSGTDIDDLHGTGHLEAALPHVGRIGRGLETSPPAGRRLDRRPHAHSGRPAAPRPDDVQRRVGVDTAEGYASVRIGRRQTCAGGDPPRAAVVLPHTNAVVLQPGENVQIAVVVKVA